MLPFDARMWRILQSGGLSTAPSPITTPRNLICQVRYAWRLFNYFQQQLWLNMESSNQDEMRYHRALAVGSGGFIRSIILRLQVRQTLRNMMKKYAVRLTRRISSCVCRLKRDFGVTFVPEMLDETYGYQILPPSLTAPPQRQAHPASEPIDQEDDRVSDEDSASDDEDDQDDQYSRSSLLPILEYRQV